MKLIIDSNCLRSDELQGYLASSSENLAVLTDFAAMEAYKGDTLVSIYESMRIVASFPLQILVLKGTQTVGSLSGRRSGLQERLTDRSQTKLFHHFAAAMARGRGVNPSVDKQLLAHGTASKTHLDQMLADAADLRGIIESLARIYTKEERARIQNGAEYTQEMIDKLVPNLLDIAANLFSDVRVKRRPSPAELPNTFLFRVALSCYLMAMRRGAFGGVAGVKAERIRNDMVDMTFVAYGTFFDGIMSADKNVNRVYDEACAMLSGLFKAKVPRIDGQLPCNLGGD